MGTGPWAEGRAPKAPALPEWHVLGGRPVEGGIRHPWAGRGLSEPPLLFSSVPSSWAAGPWLLGDVTGTSPCRSGFPEDGGAAGQDPHANREAGGRGAGLRVRGGAADTSAPPPREGILRTCRRYHRGAARPSGARGSDSPALPAP